MKARAWRASLRAGSRTACSKVGGAVALLVATGWCTAARAAGEQAASGSIVASGVVGGGLNAASRAAATNQAIGAGAAVPSLGLAGMFQALFGLVVVIALIFGCAWIARRLGLNKTAPRTGLVKLVSSTAITQKERVVVVEIEQTWLVLGVAPGSVTHLHTLAAGAHGAPTGPVSPQVAQFATDFRQRLSETLGKSTRRNVQDDDTGAAR